jgi:peptide/nickel transport system substrate-binding protein
MKHLRSAAALAVATAIALTLVLAGCSSSGTSKSTGGEGATINVGSLYEPQNLSNTGGGGQGVTEALNGNVFEGLYQLGDNGQVVPLLAKSTTVSADGLTYTFTLRDGVKFHSGKAVTSKDVKASIEYVVAPNSVSARKSSFVGISSIATPDDKTVVIILKQRSISLIYNLSYVWIVNADVKNLKTTEDGTGPYRLGTWVRGSSLTLERWSGYWGTPAKNKQVVFHYFTDATALGNALLTGQVDVITSVQDPDSLAQFENKTNYVVNNGKSTTKLLLAYNDRVAPFNNVDVRKGIYSAIDCKKLLQAIWGKYGMLIGSMVPPSDPWYVDLTNVNPYNVDLAKSELAKGGYPNGFSFTLDTPTYSPHPAVAEFLQSELAKVGVTVKINMVSPDQWYSKVFQKHDFQATLQEHVNDRDVVWYGDPNFYWGYNNPQVTKWISEAEQSTTAAGQTAFLKQVNEQIAKDAASAWLYLYPQIVVATSALSGYPLNGLDSTFYVYNIVKK